VLHDLRSLLGFSFFAVVLLAATAGVHLYFYRRLVRGARSKTARRIGGALVVLLAILLIAGPVGQRMAIGPIGALLAKAGYLWMAIGLYLLLCLGAIDLTSAISRAAALSC
jgi:hypothetical protein